MIIFFSNTAGKIPSVAQLDRADSHLGYNIPDGKLYGLKNVGGTKSVVLLNGSGGGGGGDNYGSWDFIKDNLTAKAIKKSGSTENYKGLKLLTGNNIELEEVTDAEGFAAVKIHASNEFGSDGMITDSITMSFTATNNYIRRQANRNELVISMDDETNIVFRRNTVIVALPCNLSIGDEFTLTYTGSSNVNRVLNIRSSLNSFVINAQSTSPVAIRNERYVTALINTPYGMYSYGSGAGLLQKLTNSEYTAYTGQSCEYTGYNGTFNQSRGFYNSINNCIYALNGLSNTISIINLTTGAVVNLTASYASNIVYDSVNNRIACVGYTMTIIDCSTNAISWTFNVGQHFQYFPQIKNGYLYVFLQSSTLYKFNMLTGTYTTLSVGVNSGAFAANGYLYASCVNTYKIDVTPATPTIVATINNTSRNSAYSSIYNPNNSCIYVSSNDYSDVSVVSALTDSLVTRIACGAGANSLYLDATENFLYVCNRSSTTISVIDCATNTVVQTLSCDTYSPIFVQIDDSRPNILVVSTLNTNKIYEFQKRVR